MNRNHGFILIIIIFACVWLLIFADWQRKTQDQVSFLTDSLLSQSQLLWRIDSMSRETDQRQWDYFTYAGFELPDTFICMGQVVDFTRPSIRERVDFEIYKLLKVRHLLAEAQKRRGRYEPMMLSILEEADLPPELLSLVSLESLFNPKAKSSTGPVGHWQFTRLTGLAYGLSKNFYRDQRKDPHKSTVAARDHLVDLYGIDWLQGNKRGPGYHDWWLTFIAYCDGPGELNKALIREKTKDYWSLQTISYQARRYVPRFIAFCYISQNLERFGLDGVVPYAPLDEYKETVVTLFGKTNSLTDLARAAQIDMEQFVLLNTDYEIVYLPAGKYRVKIALPPNGKK